MQRWSCAYGRPGDRRPVISSRPIESKPAAAVAARERGFASILSDVDTENRPMLDAMLRNGHDPAIRDWHVWHYRRELRAMHTEA